MKMLFLLRHEALTLRTPLVFSPAVTAVVIRGLLACEALKAFGIRSRCRIGDQGGEKTKTVKCNYSKKEH